jgi:hypothetical protein
MKFLRENTINLIYAFTLSIGIYISNHELGAYQNLGNFSLLSFSLLLIYFAELYLNYVRRNKKIQINLDFHDKVNELSLLYHFIFLPVVLYFSLASFYYYNYKESIGVILIILVFFIFFTLFRNIRYFFRNEIKFENSTHYIYDLIKIFIFFCLNNFLANQLYVHPNKKILIFLLSFLLAFILMSLSLWRWNKISRENLIASIVCSIICGLSFILFSFIFVNAMQISLISVFVFYISIAIIHHLRERNLTRQIMLEYLSIGIVFFAIIWGMR